MPSTVMVLPGERVLGLIWKSEAGFAVKIELEKVMISLIIDGESVAERMGVGVEEMAVDDALRVEEDSEVPVVWGLLSSARIWPAGWSVLLVLLVGIEPS